MFHLTSYQHMREVIMCSNFPLEQKKCYIKIRAVASTLHDFFELMMQSDVIDLQTYIPKSDYNF